jgi:hypothetical protein
MDGALSNVPQLTRRLRAIGSGTTTSVMVALLFLDGQLGPLSFTLRRAAALAVLAILAVWRRTGTGPVAAVEPSDGPDAPGRPEGGSDGDTPSGVRRAGDLPKKKGT